jgi:hypothetical protein
MRKHYWVLAVVLPAACISSSGGLPCSTTTTSPAVPGAQVTWDTPSCTMESGSGGTFSYTLELGSALSFTLGPHGACSATMNDPSSFISEFVTGSGGAQYCPDCDQGTCPEDPGESITIPAGSYSGTFQFPGDSWDGPAGDNTPLGGPLPAGNYIASFQMQIPNGTLGASLAILLEQ